MGKYIGPSNAEPPGRLDDRFVRIEQRYRVEFFQIGRVFMILWNEPAGNVRTNQSITSNLTQGYLGGNVWGEIRRFVVVRTKKGATHSICVPISTYQKKGAAKPGLDVDSHAIVWAVWEGRQEPGKLPGEEGMTKLPLRMIPDRVPGNAQQEDLHPASRINFGKVYTVEHNVRIFGIGWIDPTHIHLVKSYYRQENDFDQ